MATPDRREDFKFVGDGNTGRKRREEQRVQLRERRREEDRDHIRTSLNPTHPHAMELQRSHFAPQLFREERPADPELRFMGEWVSKLSSDSIAVRLEGVRGIGGLLSKMVNGNSSSSTNIDKLIEHEHSVPTMMGFIAQEGASAELEELKVEAAWALCCVGSGTSRHTKYVLEHGCVPVWLKLLEHPTVKYRECAIWALGNTAGDSPYSRDTVLGYGAMPAVLRLLASGRESDQMMRNATWAVSNFARGKPPLVSTEHIFPAMPVLVQLLNSEDKEVHTDSCWAISYAADGNQERIDFVLRANILPRMMYLLGLPQNSPVHAPGIRLISNLVAGSHEATQEVLDAGLIAQMPKFVEDGPDIRKSTRKEGFHVLSNICAGTQPQIQALLDSGLLSHVVQSLVACEYELRKTATYAISNVASCGNFSQLAGVVHLGVIPPLCEMLKAPDVKVLKIALQTMFDILERGRLFAEESGVEENPFIRAVEEEGASASLEHLQMHANQEIYEGAGKILNDFFEAEEVDMEGPLAGGRSFELQGGKSIHLLPTFEL